MKLIEILKSLPENVLLYDNGNEPWSPSNLIDAMQGEDDEREYSLQDKGIYQLTDDALLCSTMSYKIFRRPQ